MFPSILWEAASKENVLPLTSTCNLSCVFCSNRQNPGGVKVYAVAPLPLALVKRLIPCLDPRRNIIIGEAATRINEGEPFTHPSIWQALDAIRERYPQAPLQITTNGTLLNRPAVQRLAGLGPLSVNLSLNSATPEGRQLLMGDRKPGLAQDAARLLGEAGIAFHGSLVAMPHLVGWRDMAATCRFLQEQGAATVRLFLPGFTRRAAPSLRFDPLVMHRQLAMFVRRQQELMTIPLLLEPFLAGGGASLQAMIAGVLAGSPADRADLQRGDVIGDVHGRRVRCRVDAFQSVERFGRPVLNVKKPDWQGDGRGRGQTGDETRGAANPCLIKRRRRASGLVMNYDLDWGLVEKVARTIRHHRASRVLVLTSDWGLPWLQLVMPEWERACDSVHLAAVPSRLFGGSIAAAGLLTTFDFAAAIREIRGRVAASGAYPAGSLSRRESIKMDIISRQEWGTVRSGADYDLLLLPGIAFDRRGRDLIGRHYTCLNHLTKAVIRII